MDALNWQRSMRRPPSRKEGGCLGDATCDKSNDCMLEIETTDDFALEAELEGGVEETDLVLSTSSFQGPCQQGYVSRDTCKSI